MMKRVEPRMWPDDATILHYLSAVLHATNHGCAGVSEAWGCYGHFNAVLDSIATDRMGGLKRVEHWLGGTDEFLKGPDCELFNRYFSSESATCNGCVHLVSTDLCNNPCVHLAAHLWCATIYACNGNSMLQVVEASMRWNNATLQDAAAVLREMEASGKRERACWCWDASRSPLLNPTWHRMRQRCCRGQRDETTRCQHGGNECRAWGRGGRTAARGWGGRTTG
mmetsp:Transcript_16940/g.40697  ORF Transcript_16940/g.40697 Transcript_16940/m.40697 type:complete len:224 (+) Transcript_16940:1337-2008(+)